MWSGYTRLDQLQIPRGSQIRYGEDELYEEMKDICRQHSQLTAWYCPSCPLILAGLKVIKLISRANPAFFGLGEKDVMWGLFHY